MDIAFMLFVGVLVVGWALAAGRNRAEQERRQAARLADPAYQRARAERQRRLKRWALWDWILFG